MQAAYHLLIIGGGMAAGRLLQQLDQLGYNKKVVVISNEKHAGYNRVLLPGFLAGHYKTSDLLRDHAWSENPNISVIPNCKVENLDLEERTATLTSGQLIEYSKLIFATGSTVPGVEVPGAHLNNVFQLRCLEDAMQLQHTCTKASRAVVVGGGLLGLEAADALNELCASVRIVHRGQELMNRQLDQSAGDRLAAKLRQEGIQLSLGTQIVSISGKERVSSITLSDGSEHLSDLVLFATGASPNVSLAQKAGIECANGIPTGTDLKTQFPSVYAIGECANVNGNRFSLVDATHAQADALASTLAGTAKTVAPFTPGTRLKVSSVSVFAAGETRPSEHDVTQDTLIQDDKQGIYRRLLFKQQKLIGAVLLGDTGAAKTITQKIGSTLSNIERERLVFGVA